MSKIAGGPPSAVIAVGGSAGALGPMLEIVRRLPEDASAAILVVMHTGERAPSRLAEILGRGGPLTAVTARDGEPVRGGLIYVAPPGRHMMVWEGSVVLSAGPRINRHRPAIDVTMASAAAWAGERCVAVVLSGVLDDGAVGAALVARAGGRILVQDPESADFAGMPRAALAAAGTQAQSLTADRIAGKIVERLEELPDGPVRGPAGRPSSTGNAGEGTATVSLAESNDPSFLFSSESRLSRLACPECGGAMAEVELPSISYFRCHVGHQYSPQTLAAAQSEASERRLWGAVAALEEQATVLRYLAASAGNADTAASSAQDADRIAQRAAVLRTRVREWSSGPTEVEREG